MGIAKWEVLQELRIMLLAEPGQAPGRGRRYRVLVESAGGPTGVVSDSSFANPLDPRDVDFAVQSIATGTLRRSVPSENLDPVRTLGAGLYDALFRGPVERAYLAALSNGGEVTLRFVLGDDEAMAIPWEFLYDRRRGDFLVLSTRTPLVRTDRRTMVADTRTEPLALRAPVKVLAVASDVTGAWQVGSEFAGLRRALSGTAGLELAERPAATWPEFCAALREEQPHVLHLMVNGVSRPSSAGPFREQSVAFLAGPGAPVRDGGSYELHDVDELVDALRFARSAPSLVVINGCRTDGVAAHLAAHVPAVIGLRGDVTDAGALTFAGGLYDALGQGVALDLAVSTARSRVDARDPGGREWCAPVLYQTPASLSLPAPRARAAQEAATSWQAPGDAGAGSTAPGDVALSSLQARMAIQKTNLGVLTERSRGLGDATPTYITREIEATRAEIERLRGEIADAGGLTR